MSEMKNKVVIITGASSGIGRAAAIKFGGGGARVALVARSGDKLAEVVRLIEADGGEAAAIVADVTLKADVERVVSVVVETLGGGIDVLVNAAGILKAGTVEDTSLTDWDHLMKINVRGPFYLMQCAMPYLIEREGNVVNVSSVNAVRAFPGVLAYCVSKAALEQLTRCTALEMAGKGVRVNSVNPGVTATQLHRSGGMDEETYAAFLEHSKTTHPLGRVGQPEEVAELIYFLASSKAAWITGGTHLIDGGRGQTCAR